MDAQATSRTDDARLTAVLDELDAAAASRAPDEGSVRRHRRYAYRQPAVRLEIDEPGRGSRQLLATARNLSTRGVGLLVGSFVYPDSACVVHLVASSQQVQMVKGKARFCRYLSGRALVYEVGVEFERDIDVTRFVSEAVRLSVLVVDDSDMTHRLVARFLKSTNIVLANASDGPTAIAKAQAEPFDLILMDVDMPDMDGIEVVRQLRGAGYNGRITAMTGLDAGVYREKCLRAGFDDYLSKPFSGQTLEAQMRPLLDEVAGSAYASDPDMVELIDAFVRGVHQRIAALTAALRARETERFRSLLRKLREDATAVGFLQIGHAVNGLEQALGSAAVAEIGPRLRELMRICANAQPVSAGA